MDRAGEGSRIPSARTIALVYLLYFLVGTAGGLLMRGIVVPGDPAATASHLLASATRFRIGVAVDLLGNLLYITVTALFYRLFRTTDPTLALLMAFVSLAGCVVQIAGELSRVVALEMLRDASLATVFSPSQLQTAALASLQLYTQTYYLSLPLFAGFDTLLGTLILESGFLPRFIGIGMVAAGLGCFTFIWPPLATSLRWIVLPLGGLAELALMLWLLVKGVDRTK